MSRGRDQLASPTLAELYYQQGDLRKAIEVLRQALKNQPGNLDARQKLREWEQQLIQSAGEETRRQIRTRLERILELIQKERERK